MTRSHANRDVPTGRLNTEYFAVAVLIDGLILVSLWLLASAVRPTLNWLPYSQVVPVGEGPHAVVGTAIAASWIVILWTGGVYNPESAVLDRLIARLVSSSVTSALATGGILYLCYRDSPRWTLPVFVISAVIVLGTWRLVYHFLRASPSVVRRERFVIVVGAGISPTKTAELALQIERSGHSFVGYVCTGTATDGFLPTLGSVDQLESIAASMEISDMIVVSEGDIGVLDTIGTAAAMRASHVHLLIPSVLGSVASSQLWSLGDQILVDLRASPLTPQRRVLKRAFDLALSIPVLVLSAPIMLIIAVLIRLDSPGPVLFVQSRIGENGRKFEMYKFRSMVTEADPQGDQGSGRETDRLSRHKDPHDPRITRLGRVLRRTSLDELPQLVNIAKGDMSLVGPRPELPWIVQAYEPWQYARLLVPQGLTGWWQVNGRAEKPMHLSTHLDLFYVENYSPWLDVVILARTVLTVISRRGAH